MPSEKYTIVVSGEKLVFTRDQLESEPGNYFSTLFFGDFAEGVSGVRDITLEKEPRLFTLIQAHLRGYEIFPLSDSYIPPYMTREVTLRNLLHEARLYGLQRLKQKISKIHPELSTGSVDTSTPRRVSTPATYKFAQHRVGQWIINEITAEGYQYILKRLANAPQKQLRAYARLGLCCPGYTIVVGWVDGPENGSCALLASSST